MVIVYASHTLEYATLHSQDVRICHTIPTTVAAVEMSVLQTRNVSIVFVLAILVSNYAKEDASTSLPSLIAVTAMLIVHTS